MIESTKQNRFGYMKFKSSLIVKIVERNKYRLNLTTEVIINGRITKNLLITSNLRINQNFIRFQMDLR